MVRDGFRNESTYSGFMAAGKEEEFDRRFEQAAEEAVLSFGAPHHMYIAGRAVASSETLVERSPIDTRIIIGTFQKASREHAKQAIAAAKAASAAWRGAGYKERAAILAKAAELFSQRKFTLAATLSYENGKTRHEAMGEVDEAIDFLRYYAKEIVRNRGYCRRAAFGESGGARHLGFQGAPGDAERVEALMAPYGVFGVIAPFNFPISIAVGMCAGALVTGNTVVFKPSSTENMTMLSGLRIYELFREAGVPAGAFNYITGSGAEVGDELAVNRDVNGIVFTGSRETGIRIMRRSLDAGTQKCFILEMGGKNPVIVSKHADLECAANGIISSAFGFSGQKCSACSRIYVHDSVKEQLVSMLIDKARSLQIGNPLEKRTYMGPLIGEEAYRRYAAGVEKVRETGRLLYGGRRLNLSGGYYVEPVIAELGHENALMRDELFVPILGICPYTDFADALRRANETQYGLCAGLYSKSSGEIREFKAGIEAGVVYINRSIGATTGAIVGRHPFVGWKGSGSGGKGTGSTFYLQQFMREQSVSVSKRQAGKGTG